MKSARIPRVDAGAPEADGSGLSGAPVPDYGWFHYVPHTDGGAQISRKLQQGWLVKEMRNHHGYWSALMIWPSVYPPPEEE